MINNSFNNVLSQPGEQNLENLKFSLVNTAGIIQTADRIKQIKVASPLLLIYL